MCLDAAQLVAAGSLALGAPLGQSVFDLEIDQNDGIIGGAIEDAAEGVIARASTAYRSSAFIGVRELFSDPLVESAPSFTGSVLLPHRAHWNEEASVASTKLQLKAPPGFPAGLRTALACPSG